MTAETFHSWQRSSFTKDAHVGANTARLVRTIGLHVAVTDQPSGIPAQNGDVSPQVEILGPGDVRGVAPQAFIRHHPESDAVDVDPGVMPFVELAAPDLPWRYSPDPSAGTVRPWLVLVCAPESAGGLELCADGRTITLGAGVQELFPPGDRHLSAHVHETGSGRALARLLAAPSFPAGADPALQAGTVHLAAVVPAFQATVDARPDLPALTAADVFAWPGPPESPAGPVTLPCFHWWRFTTGHTPPFEEVANRLTRPRLPSAGEPGLGQTRVTGTGPGGATWSLLASGALRLTGSTELSDMGDAAPSISSMLSAYRTTSGDEVGLVCWPEAAGALPTTTPPPWWGAMEDHPVARIAAGLGAWCGIEWQDQLVESVRQAIGGVDVLNQKVRYQAAGDRSTRALLDRFPTTDNCWTGLRLAGTALRRLWLGGPGGQLATARWDALAGPALPPVILSSAARRALRSGTARRARVAPATPAIDLDDAIEAARAPDGISGLRTSTSTEGHGERRAGQVWVSNPDESDGAGEIEAFAGALAAAAPPPLPDGAGTALHSLACDVVAAIGDRDSDLGGAGLARVWRTAQSAEPVPEGWGGDKPIEVCARITAEPWTFLRDHAPDWLLPGIGTMPDDSIAALRTNPAFIDAFLAGLNAQMLAELRWRNVPVAAGCTPVRAFWPTRRSSEGAVLDEIVTYRDSVESLGHRTTDTESAAAGLDLWVVLIRSWLFVRWPHTQVYLEYRAAEDPVETRAPVIAGRVDHATVLFAFDTSDISDDRWRDWRVVLEEPPVGLGFQQTTNSPGSNPPVAPVEPTDAAQFAVRHLDQPHRAVIQVSREGSNDVHGGAVGRVAGQRHHPRGGAGGGPGTDRPLGGW